MHVLLLSDLLIANCRPETDMNKECALAHPCGAFFDLQESNFL